jgi:hypothetical protein
MKVCYALFALLLIALPLVSQTASLNTTDIQRDIVFLYAAGPDGAVDKTHSLGTGFFLTVPRLSNQTSGYVFLVTARHIVDPQWAHCDGPNPEKIFYRINKKSYDPSQGAEGVGYLELPLRNGPNPTYAVHSSDDVDVALIGLPPTAFSLTDYDVVFVPMNWMVSADEIKELGIGDLVASGGLLPGASGSNRNYPLFKFGYVSALPDEDIATPCVAGGPTRAERLWLVPANLFPGASGSPFYYIPTMFVGDRKTIGRGVLIGVQSSSFLLADVAGVTPISYAYDIVAGLHLPDADLYRGILPKPATSPAAPSK